MTAQPKRWLIIFIGLFAAAATTYADEPPHPKLRVLTYNIHHAQGTDGKFDYARIAKIIRDLNPDIVALQEVDRNTNRASGIDQAKRLGELTEMQHVFGTAMHYSGGQYGEALLSRFPLTDVKSYRLPFRAEQEPRCALAARVQPNNGIPELVFVGTHLCHQSQENRTEQAQRINNLFAAGESSSPVILAGDLNARPDSQPMKLLLKKHWVDAIAPQSRIDYVLFRSKDPWKVLEVKIVDDRIASDHRPVLAVLQWQGAH